MYFIITRTKELHANQIAALMWRILVFEGVRGYDGKSFLCSVPRPMSGNVVGIDFFCYKASCFSYANDDNQKVVTL